ncbi:MAG: ABC transporter ATP-binding protein [Candidatus Undinarchaeales archaeon]|jgi:ABC-2 type transport system ATP-binding protein|nr:ABC transporter ATP-binding protein [Candidatus Undinarchaeales archaeon]MDP7493414.1 ABC transporter ATP-binding protein [Candidatus Undinarchaeales archaeon]
MAEDADSDPSLYAQGLTRRFGDKTVVDEIAIVVPRGSVTGLLGPNGAGKTTAMRMMAGILRPTRGETLIISYDIWREPLKAKAALGYLPESLDLYDNLTTEEFLRFICRAYGMDDGITDEALERWMAIFGLEDLADELIGDQSKGFRQRVALASVFIHDPEVLILDEPFINLDPATSRMVKDLLMDGRDERAVLLATHLASVAEEVCDHVIVLNKGKVIARDQPAPLAKRFGGDLERAFVELVKEETPA